MANYPDTQYPPSYGQTMEDEQRMQMSERDKSALVNMPPESNMSSQYWPEGGGYAGPRVHQQPQTVVQYPPNIVTIQQRDTQTAQAIRSYTNCRICIGVFIMVKFIIIVAVILAVHNS